LIASVEATSELAWWLDNISIFTRSVTWDGRAVVDDPWKSNDAAWTPFGNIKNMANGGVLFPDRGHQLQVRARGLTQDATIQRIQFLPKYSELGNFRRAESTPSVAPAASFTSTPSVGLSVSFTSTATDADGYIAQHEWSFGDGESGWGPKVSHIYPAAGSYTVTLTVTDNNGNKSVYADTVTV
jgi:PKD repeat protein